MFGKILYTTYSEKTPAQNALFFFIRVTYFRGWTLITTVNSASALVIPYWTLTDHTAGNNGTANFAFTFENASNDNADFGIFFSNATLDSIVEEVDIFRSTDQLGYTATANFTFDGSSYDLAVNVEDGGGGAVRTVTADDIDPMIFGFYFVRDIADPDREIYSDAQYSSNVGKNEMNMLWKEEDDAVFVQLLYDSALKYSVKVSDVAPVPEPATMLLLGAGLIGLAGASRKKIFGEK